MIMFAPVRGQITCDHYRWVEDPAARTSKATVAWVVTSTTIMLIAIGAAWAVGAKTAPDSPSGNSRLPGRPRASSVSMCR
jgi:hypothetical protein